MKISEGYQREALPIVLQSFYVKTQGWWNGVDIFSIELFQYCSFTSIVQTSVLVLNGQYQTMVNR